MESGKRTELSVQAERALLVTVMLPGSTVDPMDPVGELRSLAKTAGAAVIDEMLVKRQSINPGLYVGTGKAQEIADRAEMNDANVIIFDNDLSPGQIRELETLAHRKVLDRSELILDIFAAHARTAESRLQVELAQLEYTYPRLTHMWSHLERVVGGASTAVGEVGGIGTRGPGEKQIEIDRRLVQKRVSHLKRQIAEIDQRKVRQVASRGEEFGACLVGYTNAGKSTLMNLLTDAGAYVADKLFATLDTKTRRWKVRESQSVLLSDTVGFVRDLPHHLVASFRATLEEAISANLLIHVADASHDRVEQQIRAVEKVLAELGCDPSREQSHWAFTRIMDGAWTPAQIAGMLVALAGKGETVSEIVGAAMAMREHVVPIDTGGADVIDTCGTGGTGLATFNISTAAALVCAGAGVKVAKHGNKTNTRASGSADVLAALGVNIDASPETVARCLREAGVCFCFAVRCHPAIKHAGPVRRELAVRTIFNLLGPLTNPAGARRQMVGIFRADLTETIAKVLAVLGAVRAMVVHAEDGLDELSTTSATKVSELRDGSVATRTVHPRDFHLPLEKMADLLVTSPQQSAEVIRSVLAGKKGPARDIVVLNAAAALAVADKADSIAAAIPLAEQAIDSGRAKAALEKLIAVSNESA